MEDFFYYNINNNSNIKNEITNILIFLDNINNKINYTNINIKDQEIELIKFLLNKFKKLYLFQFMLNPNETIENALNNSLITLFNEISNNLNYNDSINDNNFLEILKNKSIYKFLEELDENKNNSSSKILELHNNDIKYLQNTVFTNLNYVKKIDKKYNLYITTLYISVCSLILYNIF
jgi:hypothetical protein